MIAMRYGSLPVVHHTGGLRDTVSQLDPAAAGNGFVFHTPDCNGLRWALDQAMQFYQAQPESRSENVSRVMRESVEHFNPKHLVDHYLAIYQSLAGHSDQ